jgi:high-affinity iron transporter
MAKDLFSVPIFFIVFREYHQPQRLTPGETIEAAIIVSVLLSFVEQLMLTGHLSKSTRNTDSPNGSSQHEAASTDQDMADLDNRNTIIKRMRIQIWAGTIAGFLVALCIGAAFIAVVSGSSVT